MPQIERNGQLVEVSQAEYDALTQNGAPVTADSDYEKYATIKAKEQALTKLADADASVESSNNVSPTYQAELQKLNQAADQVAGDRKQEFATQYQQEQQDLYAGGETNRAALESELSAGAPIKQPGTVAVGVPNQQGTDGQVIGTLNSSVPGLSEPAGPIVSSPVKGLTAGGLTSGAPAAGLESAPSYPTEDPQIPVPSTEGAGPFTPPPPPDAAFLQAQVAREERWQQAAAANPEGIQDNGSVKTVNDAGVATTINRDGSYEISDASGTFRYDAAGQETSYTSPTINGYSVTTTPDGVQYTNYTQGPLTTSTITKDGEPISTTVSYDTGVAKLTSIETAGGQPVGIIDVAQGDGVTERLVVDAEGEVVSQEQIIRTSKQVASEAELQAIAENQKLREDLIAAKQQVDSGTPLSEEQETALEEQAQATAAANAELAAAEESLADVDPLLVKPADDPQVTETASQEPLPSLDTTEFAPAEVSAVEDPEVTETFIEPVPPAEVEEVPPEVSPETDPEVSDQPVEEVPLADEQVEPAAVTEEVDPTVVEQDPLADVADAAIDSGDSLVVSDADPGIPAEESEFNPPLSEIETDDNAVVAFGDDPGVVFAEDDFVATANVFGDEDRNDDIVDNFDEYLEEQEEAQEELRDEQDALNDDVAEYLDDREDEQEELRDEQDAFNDDVAEYLDDREDEQEELRDEQDAISDDVAEYLEDQQEEFDDEYEDFLDEQDAINDDVEEYLEEQEDEAEDLLEEADPALFTEEYVQEQDNPVEFAEEADDGISPYGEQDDPLELPEGQLNGVDPYEVDGAGIGLTEEEIQEQDNPVEREAARQQAVLANARAQAVQQAQRKQANDGDWRVRLRLAPNATYLYKSNEPGILQPLAVTDGVVFPYTPQITTAYRANYTSYDLTHSNYRGYFYQNSYTDDIQLQATFTAQDTSEAEYLLAVIHFFRSVTKMFYGQDPERGAPPPLVYLQGLGEYQFNLHPCVVAQFNYNLPSDVDYIRARSPNINGTNLLQRRDRQSLPTNPFSGALARLTAAGLPKGAERQPPSVPTLGTNSPTYVPTKIDISLILHPMQSRDQVSQQFSLRRFANGQLLKGGFW